MKLNLPVSNNEDEFFVSLRTVDISVPARTNGRSTEHTEIWTGCRVLATLGKHNRLKFPVAVTHRDRPDFLIQLGDSNVGIEITEAIPTQYAEYAALAEREFPEVFLDYGHFRWGSRKMSLKKMRQLLSQDCLTAPPWEGKSAEIEWANYIECSIRTKTAKLAQEDFAKYSSNWLAIYNNLPVPNVHLQDAVTLLRAKINDIWSQIPTYDTIFIEHGPVLVEITGTTAEHHVLFDLWGL